MATTITTTLVSNSLFNYPTPVSTSNYLPVRNSTEPFWHRDKHALHNHRTTEKLPEHSDIVIIGAGYAGAATAYHLVKDAAAQAQAQPPSITILEARAACSGATGRNGGHLRPDLYGHIPTYVERAGIEAAAELAEFEIAHVQAIKQLIDEEKIDCDFILSRTVDVWCNADAAKRAKEIYDKMVAHNLPYMDDVVFTVGKAAEEVSQVKGAKACTSYTAGSLWPYKFILHLLQSVLATGHVNLQTHTPVTSVTPDQPSSTSSTGFTITTPRGTMHASKVIYANNAYVAGLLPQYAKNIIPCKGICCRITVPRSTSETDAPLPPPRFLNSYVTRTEDGTLAYLVPRDDADQSIIVGGASSRHKPFLDQWYDNVDDSVLIEASKDYFDGYMQRTFRGWEESGAKVDQIWTGVMGYSWDSHPHVGVVPPATAKRDGDSTTAGQYVIAGFNGHGMPVIWLAAKGLAAMVREEKSFEEVGLPRLLKTTPERIKRASLGPEGGDILDSGAFSATKQ